MHMSMPPLFGAKPDAGRADIVARAGAGGLALKHGLNLLGVRAIQALPRPVRTSETVDFETPAASAISMIVTFPLLPCGCGMDSSLMRVALFFSWNVPLSVNGLTCNIPLSKLFMALYKA